MEDVLDGAAAAAAAAVAVETERWTFRAGAGVGGPWMKGKPGIMVNRSRLLGTEARHHGAKWLAHTTSFEMRTHASFHKEGLADQITPSLSQIHSPWDCCGFTVQSAVHLLCLGSNVV